MTFRSSLRDAVAAALLAASVAVSAAAAAPLAKGEIVDPVACDTHPGQSYALYLPTDYTPIRRWPILYIFDARERGAMAAELFREAAERLGVILVSSNNSRSDERVDPNGAAMAAMWEDSRLRVTVDPKRIYSTGFSGGARAAVQLAMVRPGEVRGVIGVGGGFPFGHAPTAETPFAFIGLAGIGDFNFGELRDLDRTFGSLGLRHRFESFPGPHDWCPAATCGDALEWLRSGEMRDGSAPRDEAFLSGRRTRALERAAELERDGDLAGARRRLDAGVAELDGLADVAPLTAELARLTARPELAAAEAALDKAQSERQAYLVRIQSVLPRQLSLAPGTWQIDQVAERLELQRLLAARTDGASLYERQAADQALAAVVAQTAFYVPRDLEQKKQFLAASRCLEIAAVVRPESAGMWLEMARLRALAGEKRSAVDALGEAVARGLTDPARLEGEPAFEKLQKSREYRELLEKLRSTGQPAGS